MRNTSFPALLRGAAVSALLGWATAGAATVQVAVAANMAAPMQAIVAQFQRDSGHEAVLVLGATGKLYAQIRHGAPFELLVAADDSTPARLEAEKAAVAGTRMTYAIGRLALWSPQPGQVDAQGAVLKNGSFQHLALANPASAPYGAAAVQVMERLGLRAQLQPRWVQGESVAQAYQFVASGNAALGFIALSQVWQDGRLRTGSAWLVPHDLHSPLRQDAVLLVRGRSNPAATALLAYLRSDKARTVLRGFGYELPSMAT